jgi:hypothetical protein
MLGQTQEAADAFAAIRAGRPVGFGFLLRIRQDNAVANIVAAAAERGLAPAAFTCGPSSAFTASCGESPSTPGWTRSSACCWAA